jgi:hypothetical protein
MRLLGSVSLQQAREKLVGVLFLSPPGRRHLHAEPNSSAQAITREIGGEERLDSGLGGRLVETFARQLGGQIEGDSGSHGTIVHLTMPLHQI